MFFIIVFIFKWRTRGRRPKRDNVENGGNWRADCDQTEHDRQMWVEEIFATDKEKRYVKILLSF